MKSSVPITSPILTWSLLSRGAWIEIHRESTTTPETVGRSSHEERGLKFFRQYKQHGCALSLLSRGAWIEITGNSRQYRKCSSRSSHEERGLKYICKGHYQVHTLSLLSRGAWIEIISFPRGIVPCLRSLLSRGAWIEIKLKSISAGIDFVAPLTRSVD